MAKRWRWRGMRYLFASAAALFVLSGCGEQAPIKEQGNRAESVATAPQPVPTASAMASAPLDLQPLQPSDADALKGELACSFSRGDDETLLIGRANVGDREQSAGVVRIGGRAAQLTASVPGGFNAMARGVTFGANGLTVTVERHAREETGNESTVHSATLLVQRGDGEEQSIDGRWTCGP